MPSPEPDMSSAVIYVLCGNFLVASPIKFPSWMFPQYRSHMSYLIYDGLFSVLDYVHFEGRQDDFFVTIISPVSVGNWLILVLNEY